MKYSSTFGFVVIFVLLLFAAGFSQAIEPLISKEKKVSDFISSNNMVLNHRLVKNITSSIPLFRPKSDKNYKILEIYPEPGVDYKILKVEPNPAIDYKILTHEPVAKASSNKQNIKLHSFPQKFHPQIRSKNIAPPVFRLSP